MDNPKVSIIIPAYNAEVYIEKCVKSIQNQSFQDFEVIIVDDGSKDNTAAIIDRLSTCDSRIKAFHKNNGGAGAAREYGVSKASGEWIMFVDCDDTITPYGLSLLISYESANVDIICGAVNQNGMLFGHQRDGIYNKENYIAALLSVQTTDGPWAKLIRHSLFTNVTWNTPREVTQNEDMLMMIKVAMNAKGSIFLTSDIVCYYYNLREGTGSASTMMYDTWKWLFNEIEITIKPLLTGSKIVKEAFLSYRLKRIYRHIILKGNFIKKDEYIYHLLLEVDNSNTSDYNKMVIKLINSKTKQRIAYYETYLWRLLYKIKHSLLRYARF